MTNCIHTRHNKDCSYCEDVASYIHYAVKEGFIEFDSLEDRWDEQIEYYKKWADYEPDIYDDEVNNYE